MPLRHGCSQWGMPLNHARLTHVNGAWVYHHAQMTHVICNTSQLGTLHWSHIRLEIAISYVRTQLATEHFSMAFSHVFE